MCSCVRPSRLRLALLVSLAGCAHGPETRWNPGTRELCAGRVCYRVGALDDAWRVAHTEGAEIGFFRPDLGAVIQGNATCRDDAEAVPLPSLTDHLLVGYSERRLLSQEVVPLAGREAQHTVIAAKLDGVLMILDLYVLKRNGCIFDLSYVAPPDRYPSGRPDFARFVAGFIDERRPA